MKRIILTLSLMLLAVPAFAATSQQDKMKTCNADAAAKSLKGDERKAFMKECLSAKQEAKEEKKEEKKEAKEEKKEATPQQAKMKKCNADAKAKNLKGDERKKFMSECLKAS